jgi:hypothetical protein
MLVGMGGIITKLGALDPLVNKAVDAIMLRYESIAESEMKNGAPWTDRTGAARSGLAAQASSDGDSHALTLYHQVPYGIFLELKNSGEYAIIMPTIESLGPRIMEDTNGLLNALGAVT